MMARQAIGYSSPRVRKSSRPLSMICENPDDSNDSRAKITTNGKVQDDDPWSRSSPKVSRAAPTRKKAVAPLQHPVMALMDSNFGSNVIANSALFHGSVEQNKTGEQTNRGSRVVKSNLNKPEAIGNKDRFVNKPCKSGQENIRVDYYTVLNGNSETDRLSDIVYSSDKLDKNHNPSLKTWSKRIESISADVSHSSSSVGYSDTDNLDPSKPPSKHVFRDDNVTKENRGGNSSGSQRLDSRIRFIVNSSDELSSDSNSDDLYRHATRKRGGDVRDNSDISNNNNCTDSSNSHEQNHTFSDSGIVVTCNYSTITNSNVTPISRLKDDTVGSPIISSHRHDIINSIKKLNSSNPGVDGSITEKSSFSEDSGFLTSTPIPANKKTRKPGHVWDDRLCNNQIEETGQNDENCGSLGHTGTFGSLGSMGTSGSLGSMGTSGLLGSMGIPGSSQSESISGPLGSGVIPRSLGPETTGSNVMSEPNYATNTLRYNRSEPNMSRQKYATGSDPRNLDNETIEWKRRVKRSVSLIKIPTSQEKTIRRRISSINLTNQSNDAIDKHSTSSSSSHASTDVTKPHPNVETSSQSNQEPVRRISAIDQSDFSLLKVMAARLNLPTRRESVIAWKEKYLSGDSPFKQTQEIRGGRSRDQDKSDDVDSSENKMVVKDGWDLTDDVKNRINGSLVWLRRELISIRLQDQSLARQFLNLRQSMNAFRLAVECEGHQELIDDAEEDMEEIRELSQLVDLPPEMFSPLSPLKHVGITRMNISSRRFSTC